MEIICLALLIAVVVFTEIFVILPFLICEDRDCRTIGLVVPGFYDFAGNGFGVSQSLRSELHYGFRIAMA